MRKIVLFKHGFEPAHTPWACRFNGDEAYDIGVKPFDALGRHLRRYVDSSTSSELTQNVREALKAVKASNDTELAKHAYEHRRELGLEIVFEWRETIIHQREFLPLDLQN